MSLNKQPVFPAAQNALDEAGMGHPSQEIQPTSELPHHGSPTDIEAEGGSIGDEAKSGHELGKSSSRSSSKEELQDGVRQAEAITATWSKGSLRTAYLL